MRRSLDADGLHAAHARQLARKRAGEAKRRGDLIEEPCKDCGAIDDLEMHHPNHDQALDVVWLCRPCHLKRHQYERRDNTRALNTWLRSAIKRLKASNAARERAKQPDIFAPPSRPHDQAAA